MDIVTELRSVIEVFDNVQHLSPIASKKAFNDDPGKPKSKPLRHKKKELIQLRYEAHVLQTQLNQLHAMRRRERIKKKRRLADPDEYRPIAPRKMYTEFVWQDIAQRQLHERLRAQSTNRELRDRLQAECNLGRQLMALLHRNSKQLAPLEDLGGRHNLQHDDTYAVFKDQVTQAEDSFLEMENILLQPAFQDPTACFVHTFLKKCGDQEFFIMESNMTLPFSAHVTANAVWKVLSTDKIKEHCYEHRLVHQSDTIVAQAFGMHFSADATDADFRGNYTLCRFNEKNRIVIVWVTLYEPVQLNDLQYDGVQCHQRGWLVFTDHPTETINSALVRSYSRLSVDTGNSAEANDLQLRSLFRLAQVMHEQIGALVSTQVEKALIEEDLIAHGWEDTSVD